jgi:REP element-mobilizing transposase RayT
VLSIDENPNREPPKHTKGTPSTDEFVGQSFGARGFFVYTVGRDEAVIREYIKNQEAEDNRLEQLNLSR